MMFDVKSTTSDISLFYQFIVGVHLGMRQMLITNREYWTSLFFQERTMFIVLFVNHHHHKEARQFLGYNFTFLGIVFFTKKKNFTRTWSVQPQKRFSHISNLFVIDEFLWNIFSSWSWGTVICSFHQIDTWGFTPFNCLQWIL